MMIISYFVFMIYRIHSHYFVIDLKYFVTWMSFVRKNHNILIFFLNIAFSYCSEID